MKALAAEMVQKFSRQLKCLGISVRELTGDMQLTKREIESTQVAMNIIIMNWYQNFFKSATYHKYCNSFI